MLVETKRQVISIIVCCYNSAERLPKVLDHLACLSVPQDFSLELIIVNNNSSDSTGTIASHLWNELKSPFPIIVVDEPNPGLMHARRTGMEKASGLYVVFCDDDNWLASNYVELAVQIFHSNPKVGVIGGHGTAVSTSTLPGWFKQEERHYAVGSQASESGVVTKRGYVWGAGMVLKRPVYFDLLESGFKSFCSGRSGESLLAGDDSEICKWHILAGYELWYEQELLFDHFMPEVRLTKSYLDNMKIGFKKSQVFLRVYDKVIRRRSISLGVMHRFKQFSILWIKLLLGKIDRSFLDKKLQYLFPNKKIFAMDPTFYSIYKAAETYNKTKK